MDPLTITAAAGSLAASIFSLIKLIGSFITTARHSRTELDAVSRELLSLHVCLEVLESDRKNGSLFKDELEISVSQVLTNIELCCGQIESMLAKLKATRFGRPVKWAALQKDEVNQLRSSLETHKSALQIVLQLNTISIVIKETRHLKAFGASTVQQTNKIYTAVQQINRKIDSLADNQKQNPMLGRLQEELSTLSFSIRDIVSSHQSLSYLAQQSCLSAQESLATIHHVNGVPELETKLDQVLEDPFINPFDEIEYDLRHAVQEENADNIGHPHKTSSCAVCSSNLNENQQNTASTKLQQLNLDWRREWTIQLKDELVSRADPGKQASKMNASLPPNFPLTDSHGTVSSHVSGIDDLTDLLSEVMTITSWNDTDAGKSLSDIRSISTSTSTTRSDISNKLQRLQTKYDSTRKRNQSLIEEITDLNQESLELREDIQRLQNRVAKARAVPSQQTEALQRECEELRQTAHQATENLAQVQASHDRLYSDRRSETQRAEANSRELAELRSSVTSMAEEIETLNEGAATASTELARLRDVEVSYNHLLKQQQERNIITQSSLLEPGKKSMAVPTNSISDELILHVANAGFFKLLELEVTVPTDSQREATGVLGHNCCICILFYPGHIFDDITACPERLLSLGRFASLRGVLDSCLESFLRTPQHLSWSINLLKPFLADQRPLFTFFIAKSFVKKNNPWPFHLYRPGVPLRIEVYLIHPSIKEKLGFIEDEE